jgi:feruloyl-CoA synthase
MTHAYPFAARAPGTAPFAEIAFAKPQIVSRQADDGTIYLSCALPLAPYPPSLAALFRSAVEQEPDRVFLAERDGADWRRLSYAGARKLVDAIAQALIERGLSAERPVAVLSGNSIEHALLMIACYTAGVPIAPVSVAYSLQSEDHAKLKYISSLLTPGLIYVSDTGPFAKALAAIDLTGVEIVAGRNGANLRKVTPFDDLMRTVPGTTLASAAGSICSDTIAKFLFTSGSTSLPKGVINTHGMLSANQQQLRQVWLFLAEQPLALVDWLPWNHTFGGNHNFNLVLRSAGTLYIDAGKPVPGLVEETVRNLREISPAVYFNVPAGYGALLPYLESDDALARAFFARLRLIFYAGAALPHDMWQRLSAISVRITGRRVAMTSSWGTTETAPMHTAAHFLSESAGNIGVPVPGAELKLVPSGSKLEARARGPNVTPGYWKRADLTAAAFDEEGFYRPGDAMRLAEPNAPAAGLIFDGRITEDFKLSTGTWVNVGSLRVGVIAAASPVLQDAIVAGENGDFIGILAWLNAAGCQAAIGRGAPASHAELARHPAVREHVRTAMAHWNATHTGTSHQIARMILLPDLPSIDANEITDKGYINQRLALERRQRDVARLLAAEPDAEVIVIPPRPS